jgi:hypothetical protein
MPSRLARATNSQSYAEQSPFAIHRLLKHHCFIKQQRRTRQRTPLYHQNNSKKSELLTQLNKAVDWFSMLKNTG